MNVLAQKTPVPGGGSAAALTAATGAALVSMVGNYSKGKGKAKSVEQRLISIVKQSEQIRKRLLTMVDLDAQAYMNVVKARKGTEAAKKKAAKKAADVPREVSQLCYKIMQLTPFLVKNGNQNLMSDIVVATDLLLAAFNASRVNVEVNS